MITASNVKSIDLNSTFDVCNPNHIYTENFEYPLPRSILESYLSGQAFDHTEKYTEKEFQLLCEDIRKIYQNILLENPEKQKVIIFTAGAPGSGKTMLLKQDRKKNALNGKHFAYICPEDVCLRQMTKTYKTQIQKSEKTFVNEKSAYDKWRPGSNAATYLIFANLIRQNFGVYFGTTLTSATSGILLKFLKKQGYTIRLIHLSTPDDVRSKSVKERQKTFVQTTEEDTKQKGLLFPQRIRDTYLKYADEIHFYYRGGVKEDAIFAARWIRGKVIYNKFNAEEDKKYGKVPGLLEKANLHIKKPFTYQKIKNLHNDAVKSLEQNELLWESTVEDHAQIHEDL